MTGTQALVFAAYATAIGGPSLAATSISEATPVQFGMVLGGIATAAAMTWRVGRWVERIEIRQRRIMERLDSIEGKQRHHRRDASDN